MICSKFQCNSARKSLHCAHTKTIHMPLRLRHYKIAYVIMKDTHCHPHIALYLKRCIDVNLHPPRFRWYPLRHNLFIALLLRRMYQLLNIKGCISSPYCSSQHWLLVIIHNAHMRHKMASLFCLEHIPKRRSETQDTGLRFTLYTSVPVMFNQDSIQYEVESYESSSIICCRRTTCLDCLEQFTHIVIQNNVLYYFALQIALFIEWILNKGMGMCKLMEIA